MEKEAILLKKRFLELSLLAYQREIATFSDFLNLNEQHIFHDIPKNELLTNYSFYGGYEQAERQMITFIPEALSYQLSYPISCIKIQAKYPKYAENLSHRDYLGALTGLGIDRCKLGDILPVRSEFTAYAYVSTSLEEFILTKLQKVRHTLVDCEDVDLTAFSYQPEYEVLQGTVTSARLDALLAFVYRTSRSKVIPWIEQGMVFANGKQITSNGYQIAPHDIISVRKQGRFVFDGVLTRTKKDRLLISVKKLI